MKKAYIAVAALLAAGSAFANAEELLPDLLGAGDTRTDTRISDKKTGWVQEFVGSSVTAEQVATNLSLSDSLSETGWYWSVANADNTAYENDANGVMTVVSDTGFSLIGRGAYGGSFVAATVNLEDLLSENETLTELSISFDASTVNNLYFSLWSWDGSTAKELGKDTTISAGDTVSVALKELTLSSSDTIFALWGSDSYGATSKISNLSSSITIIPEPSAFGLLAGVGVLALVASRRRRK